MINRHETLPLNLLQDKIQRHEQRWEKIHAIILQKPTHALGGKITDFRNILGVSLTAEAPPAKSWRYLKLLKEIGLAYFLFGTLEGQNIEVRVDDQTYQFTGKKMTAYMDTNSWISVFCAAVILRDMEAIHELVQVSESTFATANLSPIAFDLALVRLLKGLYIADANLTELLYAAFDLADPEQIDSDRFPYISHILLPLVGLLLSILSNQEKEFNTKLEEALEQHKKFWSSKKNKLNPKGWFAIHLSAIAAIAYDQKGFKLEVQSDYLPLWMVRQEF